MSELRNPLKRARGLGAAKSGVHHWWMQRVTAVALAPLSICFVWHAITLVTADYGQARAFVFETRNAVLLALFSTTMLYHSYLGLQVIVEDYVTHEFKKLATLMLLQFAHVALAVAALFAILKVAIGGTL